MPPAVSYTLGALAVQFGCRLHGNPDITVSSVAALDGGASSLGFTTSPVYREALRSTRLAAVVVDDSLAADCPVAALVHANPHATFARIANLLHPAQALVAGVHASAVVHPQARVDASAQIDAFAIIGAAAVIGQHCHIGAHCVVESGVVVGAATTLLPRVTICSGSRIGNRCLVHPGVVIGADGFGNARDGGQWVKVPQVGGVLIGDDVEIGANTTIDRGALGDTIIEDGVRLDNQIQIAHNVVIGAHTAIAACTGIAGSTHIGKRCMIGGGTGIGGQLTIGDDIVIAGFGMVTRSLDRPGMYTSVMPVEEAQLWRRIVARIKRLDALASRVKKLEHAQQGSAGGQHDD
jgi:UDP-3-O-[3-hydroxymyristoyl] glucosamine N-acyltransferase